MPDKDVLCYIIFGTEKCHDIRNIRRLYISDSIVAFHLTVSGQMRDSIARQ